MGGGRFWEKLLVPAGFRCLDPRSDHRAARSPASRWLIPDGSRENRGWTTSPRALNPVLEEEEKPLRGGERDNRILQNAFNEANPRARFSQPGRG